MKRPFIAALFLAAFIISTCFYASANAAADLIFRLDSLSMTACFPSDLLVFSKDVADDDPNLAYAGTTAQALRELFTKNGVTLFAAERSGTGRYMLLNSTSQISATALITNDYRNLSLDALEAQSDSFLSSFSSASGASNVTSGVYNGANAKFFKLNYDVPRNGSTVYFESYFTAVNGKVLLFSVQSAGTPLTDTQRATLTHIVDAAKFDGALSGVERLVTAAKAFMLREGFSLMITLVVFVVVLASILIIIVRASARKKRSLVSTAPRPTAAPQRSAAPRYSPDGTRLVSSRPGIAIQQVYCPVCCAPNWDSSGSCVACGAPLHD